MKAERGMMVVLPGRTAEDDSPTDMDSEGHGTCVGVVQFLKSRRRRRPGVSGAAADEPRDRERDRQVAHIAWELALGMLRNPNFTYIVLDELHHAIEHGYVRLCDVVAAIQSRPSHQHIVITGQAPVGDLYSCAIQ
jgi:cob(I)alamin adenosyltransferase